MLPRLPVGRVLAAAVSLAVASAFAQDPKDKKAAEKKDDKAAPKADDKKPAEKVEVKAGPPKPSPLEEALDRYYEAGKNIRQLSADLREVIVDQVIGKKRERIGKVAVSKEGEAGKLRIGINGPTGKADEIYLYDGSTFWKIEHRRKEINGFQQPAGAKPANIFELGRGPFPLPVGQTRERILLLFDAVLLSKAGEEPLRVKLTPRPGTPYGREHNEFEFRARTAEGVPFEIITRSRSGVEKTYLLDKLGTNEKSGLTPEVFKAPDVNGVEYQGWRINIQQNPPAVGSVGLR
jgi:hypothetical protein